MTVVMPYHCTLSSPYHPFLQFAYSSNWFVSLRETVPYHVPIPYRTLRFPRFPALSGGILFGSEHKTSGSKNVSIGDKTKLKGGGSRRGRSGKKAKKKIQSRVAANSLRGLLTATSKAAPPVSSSVLGHLGQEFARTAVAFSERFSNSRWSMFCFSKAARHERKWLIGRQLRLLENLNSNLNRISHRPFILFFAKRDADPFLASSAFHIIVICRIPKWFQIWSSGALKSVFKLEATAHCELVLETKALENCITSPESENLCNLTVSLISQLTSHITLFSQLPISQLSFIHSPSCSYNFLSNCISVNHFFSTLLISFQLFLKSPPILSIELTHSFSKKKTVSPSHWILLGALETSGFAVENGPLKWSREKSLIIWCWWEI